MTVATLPLEVALSTSAAVYDFIAALAKEADQAALAKWFKAHGIALEQIHVATSENVQEEEAAFVAGFLILAALQPEIAAAGTVEYYAGILTAISRGAVTGAVATGIAEVGVGLAVQKSGEELFKQTNQFLESFIDTFRGVAAPAPQPSNLTDQYTGAIIRFGNGDGVIHTATVLRENSSKTGFLVDPSSGYTAVGRLTVESITTLKPGANGLQLNRTNFNADQSKDVVTVDLATGEGHSNTYNGAGKLTASGGSNANGHYDTRYNVDAAGAWQSNTAIYDKRGHLVEQVTVNKDGSYDDTRLNPDTGAMLVKSSIDKSGNASIKQLGVDVDFNKLVGAVADTLATQLLTRVLLAHNLPAAIIAEGFAHAAINTATSGSVSGGDFAQSFAESTFSIAGGLGGSEIGALIAKALGLPAPVGTVLGNTAGGIIGQSLVHEAAQQLGIPLAGSGALGVQQFATGFAAAGGAYVGAELAALVQTPTLEGQIGGAVGASAATFAVAPTIAALFATNPVTATLGLFAVALGGDFLGSLLGGLFGSHREPPQPNAGALIAYNTVLQKFVVLATTADNHGDPAFAQKMADAEVGQLNTILKLAGGRVTNTQVNTSGPWKDNFINTVLQHTVGYYKQKYYFNEGNTWPNDFPNKFGSVEEEMSYGVIHTLKTLTFAGGDANVKAAIQNSKATTLTGMLRDVQSAYDLSSYQKNPLVWNLSLGLANDAVAAVTAWNDELASSKTLGLVKSAQLPNVTSGVIAVAKDLFGKGNEVFMRDANGRVAIWHHLPDKAATLVAPGGASDTVNLSKAVITMVDHATLRVVGRDNTVLGASYDKITFGGPANTANSVWASEATILTEPGTILHYGGTSSYVTGTGAVIKLLKDAWGTTILGDNVTVYGDTSQTKLNFAMNANNSRVVTNGAQFSVGAQKKVVIEGRDNKATLANLADVTSAGNSFSLPDSIQATIHGDDNDVTLGRSDLLHIYGTSHMAGANHLHGAGYTLHLGAMTRVALEGGDSVTINADGNDRIELNRAWGVTINGKNCYIYGDTSQHPLNATINGADNWINTNGATFFLTDRSSVNAPGQGNLFNLGELASYAGNNNRIVVPAWKQVFIKGDSNEIQGDKGDLINIYGSSHLAAANKVFLAGGTVHMGRETHVALGGDSTYVRMDGACQLDLTTKAWGITIIGDGSTINGDTSQTRLNFTVDGNNNTVKASNATMVFTAGKFGAVYGDHNIITTGNGDVLTVYGSDNKVCLTGNAQVNFVGSGNHLLHDPIVINLEGKNVYLDGDHHAFADVDLDHDGHQDHVAWFAPDQGVLEFSEELGHEHPSMPALITGMAELRGLDGNRDGVLDHQDTAWHHLTVWIDANENGSVDIGERKTLDELGVTSLDLDAKAVMQATNSGVILEEGIFHWQGGRDGHFAAVALEGQPIPMAQHSETIHTEDFRLEVSVHQSIGLIDSATFSFSALSDGLSKERIAPSLISNTQQVVVESSTSTEYEVQAVHAPLDNVAAEHEPLAMAAQDQSTQIKAHYDHVIL